MSHTVIAGNGPAAHRLAERMTALGHDSTITILGAEPRHAYNRVLLGAVLDGSLTAESLRLPELSEQVRVQLGVRATSIDRHRRIVHTSTGVTHRYDTLVLATGARPRTPNLPGATLAETLLTLRTLDDCERVARLATASDIAVLGGGVLGVEAARGLVGRGAHVTLVHPEQHLMDRHIDNASGRLLADQLRAYGVDLRLGRTVVQCRGTDLVLDDGEVVTAAGTVLCAGATPNTELASTAGLTVRDGIVVDDELRCDDPYIYAIGDCAEHNGTVSGTITPAWEQAEALARTLTGTATSYRAGGRITRLKARGIDLVSLGDTCGMDSPDADTELVTLSDPTRGRYAKLALRDEHIAGAVLLGFSNAIAVLTQLHDRGRPVPADRLGLLLGTATATATEPATLPGDAVVCRCNNVTKDALIRASRGGARSLGDIAHATRATTGCGNCTEDVRRICGAQRTLIEQEGAA